MNELNFIILNGRTPGDTPAVKTFCNKNGASVIDLVWANHEALPLISNLTVSTEAFSSDHFPVTLNLFSSTAPEPPQTRLPSQYNFSFKWNQASASSYILYLAATDNTIFDHIDDPNSKATILTSNIKEAASYANMKIKKKIFPAPPNNKPWFDKDYQHAKKETKEALRACHISNFHENDRLSYLTCKTQYKNMIKLKKKLYIEEIQRKFANTKNPTEFWQTVKCCKPKNKTYHPGPDIQTWNTFYESIYPKIQLIHRPLHLQQIQELDCNFTMTELDRCLKNLKKNKSPGTDQISNEFLTNLPSNWKQNVLSLFNSILTKEETPAD